MVKLNKVPVEIKEQVSKAIDLLCARLHGNIKAIYLYGSSVDGGLKPKSDIDLFVILNQSLDELTRQNLQKAMLTISSLVKEESRFRPLEVTMVTYSQISRWHFPPKREFQFGEWLRQDINSGVFEPPKEDPDLAILLTKIRKNSLVLFGPAALKILDPIPRLHFVKALIKTLNLWDSENDIRGDELHITLTTARIWYSASTGHIAPKDVAAEWLLSKVPSRFQDLLIKAREGYLGVNKDLFDVKADRVMDFVSHAKIEIESILEEKNGIKL